MLDILQEDFCKLEMMEAERERGAMVEQIGRGAMEKEDKADEWRERSNSGAG